MRGMTSVVLAGNITRDPEARETRSGSLVINFGVAVNEVFTDAGGEKQERASFYDVTAFGKTAEVIERYLSKGDPILIEGALRQDRWEDRDSGQNRSKVLIVAQRIHFIGGGSSEGSQTSHEGRGDTRGSDRERASSAPRGERRPPREEGRAPRDDFKDIDFGDEDDIPF